MRSKKKGFTLIELMIVVAIIAIIAAIAIPAFLRARITANEGAAVATLKSIFTSEGLFQSGIIVDENQNGSGEYGTLGELTGAYTRQTTATGTAAATGPGQVQAFITASLRPATTVTGNQAGGAGSKSGYLYSVLLPGAAVVTDTDDTTANAAPQLNDAVFQESRFRAYAWPNVFNNSGIRCFAINETGEVLTAPNVLPGQTDAIYEGTGTGTQGSPGSDAAASANGPNDDSFFAGLFQSGQAGGDGQVWVAAGN